MLIGMPKIERDINPREALTSLGLALFSGLQSGLIPIPCSPIRLAGKAQMRTCEPSYHPERYLIHIAISHNIHKMKQTTCTNYPWLTAEKHR